MDGFLTFIDGFTLLTPVKALLVVGTLVYVIFAFLISRQITVMSRAISMKDDFILKIMGLAHLIYAVMVLLVVLLI